MPVGLSQSTGFFLLLEGFVVMTFLTLFLINLLGVWILEEFLPLTQNLSQNTGSRPRWPRYWVFRLRRWCFNHILTTNKMTCVEVRGFLQPLLLLLISSINPALDLCMCNLGWENTALWGCMHRLRFSEVERRCHSQQLASSETLQKWKRLDASQLSHKGKHWWRHEYWDWSTHLWPLYFTWGTDLIPCWWESRW